MTLDLAPFHPELAATGAVLGIGGGLLAWRVDVRAAVVVAVVTAGALVGLGQAPWLLLVAVAIGAAATATPPPVARWCAPAAAVVTLSALQRPTPAAALLVAATAAIVAFGSGRPMPDRSPIVTAALVGAALAGTFCGAPDTEAAVLAGAALVPALLGSLVARPQPVPHAHLAPLLLATWTCVDGYRGRPAGLTAAVVALTVVALVAVGVAARRNPLAANLATLAVAAAGCIAAARTIGLDETAPTGSLMAAALVSAVIAGAAGLSVRAGSPRTPGG